MREIKFEVKFRRKDGSDGYIETLTLDDLLNRNGCLYNLNLWEIVYKRQYTGLKDKNGKEIYEGDVVKKHNLQWVIAWGNDDYWTGWDISEHDAKFTEVIGNIYENPELIKETQ